MNIDFSFFVLLFLEIDSATDPPRFVKPEGCNFKKKINKVTPRGPRACLSAELFTCFNSASWGMMGGRLDGGRVSNSGFTAGRMCRSKQSVAAVIEGGK